ncbi:hypothetical protein E1B28_002717 [Marasmius oreades]|uniref:Uncharacterized protein n=1 Tax=Marasmius oreades TaxID=181124 RepID=A0A9P7RN82_9AGAR|nr:uncharacterized protein E1B28_002717 [Marasmius oreades]KAG7086789.1 hypothetical protein E1B28_002717 [Marasmius oreades]
MTYSIAPYPLHRSSFFFFSTHIFLLYSLVHISMLSRYQCICITFTLPGRRRTMRLTLGLVWWAVSYHVTLSPGSSLGSNTQHSVLDINPNDSSQPNSISSSQIIIQPPSTLATMFHGDAVPPSLK